MNIPQLVISMVLFMVLFFGIGFLLNMVLRSTWVMAVIYPIIVILIIDNVSFFEYFTSAGQAFPALWEQFISLAIWDIMVLVSGLVGAILSGVVIKMLRVRGYQMF
ncbi:YuiB family protein [Alkalihalobacillus pseudalcaliphilus]|uniref:YuiB family protein n=1 Tax=Alkalihalobacillus pseudalcaliphilus TaxID=79884 RepID=UPI00064D9040|nr:YuiB family protein [Alkalihalobacillus pseudalcaliphilus]KMK77672.1 membrane protein [Alkalihalobacillus pseudalcaliphilus]